MRHRLLALVAVIGLCVTSAVAVAQPGELIAAVVSQDDEMVVVRYRLPAPVDRFVFADRGIIRDLWQVTTPGLSLSDGIVTADRPFAAFEVQIRPDATEVDRTYVGLSRIGDGFVLYGPGLKAEGSATSLHFALNASQSSLPKVDPINGYAYIGPTAQITNDAQGSLVVGANAPAELTAPLREGFFESLAFYEARLDAGLSLSPALIISVDSPGPAPFRGDVTDTGVISVRFHGDAWETARDRVVPFVWHETFHLWNGHGVRARDEESAPWLHEGGAEYAATVGAVSTGRLTEGQALEGLTRRVNGCRRALGARDFDPARLRSDGGPYDCGVLIQWLADLEVRTAGDGNIFSLWKAMLDSARSDAQSYGVDDFRRKLAADSAVTIMLEEPGPTRWQTIRTRLIGLGVTVENRPSDEDLMGAALFHVARLNCKSGGFGFYNTPGALKLDGADCGPLSGEPIIDTVETFAPQSQGRAMFDAVQARCAEGLPIRYGTRDGRVLEAVCGSPLTEPEVWQIVEAPPLSVEPP